MWIGTMWHSLYLIRFGMLCIRTIISNSQILNFILKVWKIGYQNVWRNWKPAHEMNSTKRVALQSNHVLAQLRTINKHPLRNVLKMHQSMVEGTSNLSSQYSPNSTNNLNLVMKHLGCHQDLIHPHLFQLLSIPWPNLKCCNPNKKA
jgi:hypothetical protein